MRPTFIRRLEVESTHCLVTGDLSQQIEQSSHGTKIPLSARRIHWNGTGLDIARLSAERHPGQLVLNELRFLALLHHGCQEPIFRAWMYASPVPWVVASGLGWRSLP
jgi:hypothetical protein